MKKYDKQRLFEVMSRLDKTFKPKLNESIQHPFGWGYPAGAENDPRAPYNQPDDDTVKEIKFYFNPKYPNTFEVRLISENHGIKDYDGFELIDQLLEKGIVDDRARMMVEYFEQFRNGGLSNEIVKSKEFTEMGYTLLSLTVDMSSDEIDWEYEEEPEPPELDERDWKQWSKEKTAGEYDRGDYYEVENGQFIDVGEYDKWEHGKIMGRYNGKGQKVDIETGYPLD